MVAPTPGPFSPTVKSAAAARYWVLGPLAPLGRRKKQVPPSAGTVRASEGAGASAGAPRHRRQGRHSRASLPPQPAWWLELFCSPSSTPPPPSSSSSSNGVTSPPLGIARFPLFSALMPPPGQPPAPQRHNAYSNATPPFDYVRGVNLGGWLTLERYIAPYTFAVTDCHLRGDLCWYPGQLSAPSKRSPEHRLCDLYRCRPHRTPNVWGDLDYPLDEHTLAEAFGNSTEQVEVAAQWFNAHFEHFLKREDLEAAAAHGVTHVRVPLPHWILGDVRDGEPWIVGDRWTYFLRMLGWCRDLRLQVWPDIHTAPGSQNGFDNSGRQLDYVSCQGWSGNPEHVQRSLQVIRDVTARIVVEGYQDVVTGFGLLNEPFKDCHRDVYLDFINQGHAIVRSTLGPDTAVYVSDLFLAKTFNNGQWPWLGVHPPSAASTYNNTFLDSHYYHVFAEQPRALSPRQHIAYVCQNEYRDTISCCYKDGPSRNTAPAPGVKRMVGEWSAAYDTLPVAKLHQLMDGIAASGEAPEFDRLIPPARQDFLKNFVQAQMVAYEASSVGTSGAWFYWTLKMEGGAFAEWDFLRGSREGWIPIVPRPNQTSQSLYGTCYDIIFRTADSLDIVNEFPDPSTLPANNWQGVDIDDDVVVTHGQSLLVVRPIEPIQPVHHFFSSRLLWPWMVAVALLVLAGTILRRRHRNGGVGGCFGNRPKSDYSSIPDSEDGVEAANNGSSTNGHLSISV